jgi:ribosomal protein S18 acetylase RimI-like enzyme
LRNEFTRIAVYYSERQGGFWVAVAGTTIVGMFGLVASSSSGGMELVRLCVEPGARRQGIAREMLAFAEVECHRRKLLRVDLSTSEFHSEAISLYRNVGYQLTREQLQSTAGGAVRTLYFSKQLPMERAVGANRRG